VSDDEEKELDQKLMGEISEMEDFHKYLKMIMSPNSYTSGLLVLGAQGLGKSTHVDMALQEAGKTFTVYNTQVSPLGLYEQLYLNSGKDDILVLDDIDEVLKNPQFVGLLKAALGNAAKKRTITWHTMSPILKKRGLPNRFEFAGKLIIICNEMKRADGGDAYRAFLDRVHICRIEPTLVERKKMVRLALGEQKELLEFMERNVNFGNAEFYNLRSARKASAIWGSMDQPTAEKLILGMLRPNRMYTIFTEIEERGGNVDEKISLFVKKTARSRRTYFNIKRKYRLAMYPKYVADQMDLREIRNAIDKCNECNATKQVQNEGVLTPEAPSEGKNAHVGE
jgi:hypothetical protein